MIQSNVGDPEDLSEAKLPRRDWILLPAISLLTICAIVGATDLVSRSMFAFTKAQVEDCMALRGSPPAARGIPGCVCTEKIPENQPVAYRFNSSGYRADADFAPRPPEIYRIVLVGSSFPLGMRVPVDQTLTTLLPAELSQRTGRRVELFDQALPGVGGRPYNVALRLDDALAVKPDMILWMFTPRDIEQGPANLPGNNAASTLYPRSESWMRRIRRQIEALFAKPHPESSGATIGGSSNSTSILREFWDRTALTLRHYMFQSQAIYVKSFLLDPGGQAEFLRTEPNAEAKAKIGECEKYAAEVEQRAAAAGVPLVAVFVPNRAQAAMLSMGEWPPGFDPYKLDSDLRSSMVSHGGTYIDILPDFRTMPNPEQFYFPVDGHPDARGHAMLAAMVARELTAGAVPALKAVTQSHIPQEQAR
ncbi:MAG: hypothetical protein ABR956_00265 [Terracidiphilus sp.]|jgi:hypothetical protein